VLLVDTFDTLGGVRRVIDLVTSAPEEIRISAVRLDSGDLGPLAGETRRMLDAAGLPQVGIFASSGLDEHVINELLESGAPINGFGVGTGMSVSDDAPALDIAYKLSAYGGAGRTKLSRHKPILPGRKQLFRQEGGGTAVRDVIGRAHERLDGRPLLQLMMQGGTRVPEASPSLESLRRLAAEELARLPQQVTNIAPAAAAYPVVVSDALGQYHASVREAALARSPRST
jgi:nicotinate phosphoribosyltransferase